MKYFLTIVVTVCLLGKGSHGEEESDENPNNVCSGGCTQLIDDLVEVNMAQNETIANQQTLINQLAGRIEALEPEDITAAGCPEGKTMEDCRCAEGFDCSSGLFYLAGHISCFSAFSIDEVTITCVPGDNTIAVGTDNYPAPMKTLDCTSIFSRMTSCVSSIIGANLPEVTIDNSGQIGKCQITCPVGATYCKVDAICTSG